MGQLLLRHIAILHLQIVEKRNKICPVRKNGMLGETFFELQVIDKGLDNWMSMLHKKTIAAKY